MELLDNLRNKVITLDELRNNFGINIREYDDRLVLNYDQIKSSSQKFHPIVRVCRQLILARDFSRVLHRSFDRFFNYGEDKQSNKFDVLRAQIDKKYDGSLIGVYWDGKRWCHCSKSMAFAEGPIQKNNDYETFSDVITNKVDLTPIYKNGEKDFSYLFELTSEYDPHVTKYTETKMILLAVRNKISGKYENREEEARRIGWEYLPQTYEFKTLDEILSSLDGLPASEEGYVCTLGDWRIKVKNPVHIAIASMKGNGIISPKRIIQIVQDCNEDEYLSYYPEDKERFIPYIKVRENLEDYYTAHYERVKDIRRQKDFAAAVKDIPYNNILFKMRQKELPFEDVFLSLHEPQIERIYEKFVNFNWE